MNITRYASASKPQISRTSIAQKDTGKNTDPNETVTYDSTTDCYHYEGPGYHRSVCKSNPVSSGLQIAGAVAGPAAVGAIAKGMLGTAAAVGLNLVAGPGIGAALGGTIAGVNAWEETHKNPMYTGLAAAAGALVGAIAFPLLQTIGTFGGTVGTVLGAGIAGVGAGMWEQRENERKDLEALAHGYQPPATAA